MPLGRLLTMTLLLLLDKFVDLGLEALLQLLYCK